MIKHYVIFYSPGTIVAETNTEEIASWNVEEAVERAKDILQRHNAKPYGFQFTTRERKEKDFNSKEVNKSNMYYLGGKIETLEGVKKRNDPKDRILISNMENNGYSRIITNDNSWRWTQPIADDDVVLDYKKERRNNERT